MTIRKIEAGRVITKDINTFIGQEGTIFYDERTGEFRLSDGITEGGIPLGSGGGGYVLTTATSIRLGGVRIGAGISVSPNGTISVNTGTTFNLNTATTSTLGGVKIGTGIDISEDGTISVNSSTYFTLTAGTDTAVSTSTGNVTIWNISTLQSVTNRGSTTSNTISITNTTTGALTVAGGVNIGGNLYVGGDITGPNGSLVLIATTSTAPNRQNGQLWFNSEDGRAYIKYDGNWVDLSPTIVPPVSTYLGELIIDGTTISTIDSTLTNIYIDSNLDVIGNINAPSIYDNGNRVVTRVQPNGSTYIGVENVISTGTQTSFTIVNLGVQTLTAGTDTVVSSSTGTITVWTTSTLQSITNRGATTNNTIRITNNTNSTSTTTGGLIVSGGVGIGGDLYVAGRIVANELDIQYTTVTTTIVVTDDIIKTYNTTTSISTTTGALVVAGGVGIGGDINVGGDIFINKDIRDINGSVIHIATTSTAPNRQNGQLWFNSDDGRAYIKYDGNWVDFSPSIVPPVSTYLGELIIDGTTISTVDSTLTNIYIDSILDVTGAIYTNNYLVSTLTNVTSGIGISVSRNNSGTVTVSNAGVLEIVAGVDTSISTATGVVIINNTSTLQTVTNRGSTTSNAINITNATTSALTVAGGVSVGGDIFINSDIKDINGSVIHIATTSTAPNRQNGQVWFNSEDGRAYIKYDGNWVDLSPSIVPPVSTYLGELTIDGTTISTIDSTLTNIYIDSNLDVTGNINAPSIYDNGNRVVTQVSPSGSTYIGVENVISTGTQTSFTIVNLGVQTLTAGTDTAVSSSTGTITVWTTSTLQSVTNRGATTTNTISIINTASSTSTTTGALVVGGGVGIGGDLYVGGKIVAKELEIQYTTVTTTIVQTDDIINTYNTTTSTSTDTGALTVAGGVGIGGDLNVGGALHVGPIYDSGNRVVTSVIANSSTYIGITNLVSTGTQTSFTIVNLGVQTLTAGTDTAINTSTGEVIIWTTSTLQSVTDRGSTTTNAISIVNTTNSTSSTTGALVVSGGVGIGGDVWVGGVLYAKDLGSPTNRIGKIYLEGQTIDLGGTLISTALDGGMLIQKSNGDLEKLATRSLTLGSTGTGSVALSVVDGTLIIKSSTVNVEGLITTGTVTATNIIVNGLTSSNSTNTGALIVAGGVGIGGSVYAGPIYDSGNRVVTSVIASGSTYIGVTDLISTGTQTSFTIVNLGVQTLTAGTDTTVSSSTGTVTIWTTSTLQSVTNRGATTTNAISITNATASTSTTTGALIVTGGVGIGGNLYISGEIVAQKLTIEYTTITTTVVVTDDIIKTANTTSSTGTYTGALVVGGGAGIGGDLYVGGFVNIGQTSTILGSEIITTATIGNYASNSNASSTGTTSSFLISNLTISTSTNTGALIVTGGVGIGGALYVNTTSFIAGAEIITSATINTFASKTTIIAGTDTAINTSTGEVTIWTTSTLQSVTDRGSSTTNIILVNNVTESTSTDTGALIVTGGVGIGGALYVNTTSFAAGAEILTTGTIELYAVTLTGVQTLTNKTIIVPSGGAIYFADDVALSQAHGATIPYQQKSAAPKMYTNADFNTGILWKDAGEFNPDDGWTVIDSVADSSLLPVGYTGAVYDAYITLDNNHVWYWAALSITDLKPGDHYYDDVNFTINICFVYLNPDSGNLTYAMLDLTPR